VGASPDAHGTATPNQAFPVKRLIVPVDLGGSEVPCAWRPPRRPAPTPETVSALIEHYVADRTPSGGAQVEVAFFRGGLPSLALLQACRPYPVRVACSPADLSRAGATWLRDQGVGTIELEVFTFEGPVLKAMRRGYTTNRCRAMLDGLSALGMRRGVVLAPGLPGSSHAQSMRDAAIIAGHSGGSCGAEFARVLPVLAYADTDLAMWALNDRWTPMTVAEAVTTSLAMDDRLRAGGVEVVRIGQQPGQDIPDELVAGPWHPNLRGLVETRRFRTRMAEALAPVPRSAVVELRVHPKDLSWAKGTANANVRALRAAYGLPDLSVTPDPQVPRGTVRVAGGTVHTRARPTRNL
jgi:hypothetical protein